MAEKRTRRVRVVTEPDLFKCNDCDFVATENKLLKDHIKEAHTTEIKVEISDIEESEDDDEEMPDSPRPADQVIKQKRCAKCLQFFDNHAALQQHLKTYHDTRGPKTCKICNIILSPNSCVFYHQRTVHKIAIYDCKKCDNSFPTFKELLAHRKTAHTTKNCNICDEEFASQALVDRHKRIFHKEYNWKCNVCQKSFYRSEFLKKHYENYHHLCLNYCCNVCFSYFSDATSLFQHQSIDHSDHKHRCDMCPKIFIRQYYLFRHIRRFHKVDVKDEQPYIEQIEPDVMEQQMDPSQIEPEEGDGDQMDPNAEEQAVADSN